jgi:putative effector of murein hydrolase LrgA (UPF0299 family)
MKGMVAHMLVIAVLGHVGVITDQDLGQDQGLRVAKVIVGAKEMVMMIIALTEEENRTGMKEGMMI